jgi:hypothetical protein
MSVNQIARLATERRAPLGPPVIFALALAVAAASGAAAAALLHWDYVYPLVSTLMLACAALIAMAGWRRKTARAGLNYVDVAGALVLIALAVAVLIDPQQLLRIAGAA